MKASKYILSFLLIGLMSTGTATVTQAQAEYDDMYFSAKDRKVKTSRKKISKQEEKSLMEEFNERYYKTYDPTDTDENEPAYAEDYYYSDYPSGNYYVDTLDYEDDFYNRDQPQIVNNYYGNVNTNPYGNPYGFNQPFNSMSFAMSPYGWSMGYNIGWGNGFYDPYYNGMFYNPYYSYNMYRWGYPRYGGYGYGYNQGYYDGFYGYPYYGSVCYGCVTTGESSSSRNVVRGGRYTRGSVLAHDRGNLGRMSSVQPARSRSSNMAASQNRSDSNLDNKNMRMNSYTNNSSRVQGRSVTELGRDGKQTISFRQLENERISLENSRQKGSNIKISRQLKNDGGQTKPSNRLRLNNTPQRTGYTDTRKNNRSYSTSPTFINKTPKTNTNRSTQSSGSNFSNRSRSSSSPSFTAPRSSGSNRSSSSSGGGNRGGSSSSSGRTRR